MKNKDVFINVNNGKIEIGFSVISKQEDGVVASYMPGFDIYYSSPDMETAQKRGEAMIHNFFKFWIDKQSWKKFVLKIHALGFRAKLHNLKVKNLLAHRPDKAGFYPELNDNSKIFNDGSKVDRSSSVVELVS
ncbi:MAG: hypothetical protein PSN34_01665 [Urechidicola sp.]|nr:hypothetical protein [Urechidicola sp.]